MDTAKRYLDWHIGEQNRGDGAAAKLGEALVAANPRESVEDAAAEKAPSQVELFGGGGCFANSAPLSMTASDLAKEHFAR